MVNSESTNVIETDLASAAAHRLRRMGRMVRFIQDKQAATVGEDADWQSLGVDASECDELAAALEQIGGVR